MFLIGVFAADLLFNAFPQDVNFAIYAEGTVKKGGSFSATLRIEDELGYVLFKAPADVAPEPGFNIGRFSHVVRASFKIEREGHFVALMNDRRTRSSFVNSNGEVFY